MAKDIRIEEHGTKGTNLLVIFRGENPVGMISRPKPSAHTTAAWAAYRGVGINAVSAGVTFNKAEALALASA